MARTATDVLTRLPAQVEAALGGQAGNVRAAVAEATHAAQAAGLQELRAALAQHSDAVKGALSLDRDGPVQQLRRDMLHELAGTRRELADQLSTVRALPQATQAQQAAAAKNSRAVGAEWEAQALAIANEVITAAGDRFEATGSQPARLGGSTKRTGDAVATVSRAITGPGRTVRIAIECKKRARPLTASQLRAEIAACRQARDAVAGLVLVPTTDEVPGGGHFARVDDLAFVAACEESSNVSLVYLILRELTALVTGQHDGNEVDLAKAEAQINYCLNLLTDFDEVARLANAAEKSLHAIRNTGGAVKAKMQAALNGTLQALSG